MKKIQIIVVLVISVIFLSSSAIKCQCVSDTNNVYTFFYKNVKYEIVKENKTWINASVCAVERGGKLAEINSKEEQDSVFFFVKNAGISASNTIAPDGGGASYLWIGGNDMAVEGRWVWNGDNDDTSVQFWHGTSSGSAVDDLYNNWGNEPDDWQGQDGLGLAFTNWPLGSAGQWNDVDHTNQLYYIIEYEGIITGIIESSKPEKTIFIYPNPASGQVKVSITDKQITGNNNIISIYNTAGKLINKEGITKKEFNINISNFDAGIYYIIIETSGYKSQPAKLIVK